MRPEVIEAGIRHARDSVESWDQDRLCLAERLDDQPWEVFYARVILAMVDDRDDDA